MAEIRKESLSPEIPSEIKTFAFLSRYYGINDWDVYQRLPVDVTDYLIKYVGICYEAKDPTTAVEVGVINAIGKLMNAIKS